MAVFVLCVLLIFSAGFSVGCGAEGDGRGGVSPMEDQLGTPVSWKYQGEEEGAE